MSAYQSARLLALVPAVLAFYLLLFLAIPHKHQEWAYVSAHKLLSSTVKSQHAAHDFGAGVEAVALPPVDDHWIEQLRGGVALFNAPREQELRRRLEAGDQCGAHNATQVVLIGNHWIEDQYAGNVNGGEIYWFNSFVRSLERLGRTVLLAPPSGDGHLHLARQYHARYPGCVKLVIADDVVARDEHASEDPLRLPDHLVLSFDYFGDSWYLDTVFGPGAGKVEPPLGPSTVITANPFPPEHLYHGMLYSISNASVTAEAVPRAKRPGASGQPGDRKKVWIYGKTTSYFQAFAPEDIGAVAEWLNVELVTGMVDNIDIAGRLEAGGITNLGKLYPHEFYDALAECSAILGLGHPMVSPTAYEALYLGIPFINPIMAWDEEDPYNDTKWTMQHKWLHQAKAEHVYEMRKGDLASLQAAMEAALADDSFESYVLPSMTEAGLDAQVDRLLSIDWKVNERIARIKLGL